MTRVIVLFWDGVGLGADDPEVNPLATATMPVMRRLLGGARLVTGNGVVRTDSATMVPTDASMGVPGRPQSATGQTALLTGLNAPAVVGGHYGPRPNAQLRKILEGETLFSRVLVMGRTACFANAFPATYFDAVDRGKRLHGAIPHAAQAAGLALRTANDLAAGRALSVDLTNAGWRNGLGYPEMPLRTAAQAGSILAGLSADHDLVFFDQWVTDMLGHRSDRAAAVGLFEDLDVFLGSLLDGLALAETLVIIISDHGNVEDCSHRRHTENPVPTVLVGAGHAAAAASIRDLTDLAPIVGNVLSSQNPPSVAE